MFFWLSITYKVLLYFFFYCLSIIKEVAQIRLTTPVVLGRSKFGDRGWLACWTEGPLWSIKCACVALFLWRLARKMTGAELFDVSVSIFKLTSHLKAGIQKIPHRSTYFHLFKFEFVCYTRKPSNYASYHRREGRVCMTFIRRKTNISLKPSKTLINKKLGV